MPLKPLTPTGVSEKIADLYALSDNNLFAEAQAAQNNLRLWLSANFILNAAQVSYINTMDNLFVQSLASRVGLALHFRLPIIFSGPDPLPPPIISKLVRYEDTIMSRYRQATGMNVTGELLITVEYP